MGREKRGEELRFWIQQNFAVSPSNVLTTKCSTYSTTTTLIAPSYPTPVWGLALRQALCQRFGCNNAAFLSGITMLIL